MNKRISSVAAKGEPHERDRHRLPSPRVANLSVRPRDDHDRRHDHVALLTTGALSDHIGRRPTTLGALMLNIMAMAMFITAGSGAALTAARAVQGFATGIATAALGATILDVDQRRGAILNSVTVFAGLTVGTLGAATLVTFAP